MKVIGVTGGIGSGKSTVCSVLIELGFPVYNADDQAKGLINTSVELIGHIKSEFGDDIYNDQGIDRQALASLVFTDPEKLRILSSLVHPEVAKDFNRWKSEQESPVVFKEAAILFESGADKGVDESVLVTCPEDIRIDRVVGRDGVNADLVKARISNQWSEERKRELADHEIINDGQTLIIPQINALLDLWIS